MEGLSDALAWIELVWERDLTDVLRAISSQTKAIANTTLRPQQEEKSYLHNRYLNPQTTTRFMLVVKENM